MPDQTWQTAVTRMEEAKRTNAPELDLSGLGLTVVPDSVAQLASLKALSLANNQVRYIPDSLARLTNLQVLHLTNNQIQAIPESLARLTSLGVLNLSGNQIQVIPDSLAKLTNLWTLYLTSNQISAIPDSLAKLTNLETLLLNSNRISAIPDSLAQLTNLQTLSLDNNQISAIPDSLAQLANLQSLDLSGNQISAIPDSLAQLANLQILWLNHNQISAIPDSLAQLANLRELEIQDNPLPEELLSIAKGGVGRLFRYLRSTAVRKVYPRTVKLVLLGEPKSGKTTLLEALKGDPQPCVKDRPETLGVVVESIRMEHPGDRRAMHLSVWDFAGQHIEHATHQFFLTEGAIYLILWNARMGAESGRRDLWYWLELLKMRVPEPKFLLVATHTERTPADLNLSEIERAYPGCQGNFPVDLDGLKGFEALRERIRELAAQSPSLRAEWPPAWLEVRNEVREMRPKRPYITPVEFRRVMKSKGVSGAQAQDDLAAQLHDLGEILYFRDRDQLSSLVILDPEWVTERVALVVRSKEVRERGGMLSKADLDKLWEQDRLPPEVREHLIHLMDGFDLTYSTGDRRDVGMVVEALPYSSPEERKRMAADAGVPRMEMIYRFPSLQRHLPPGIPTWGIARAHRMMKGKAWRDAAEFSDPDTNSTALILASDTAKEVRLQVAADYPPFFFGQMQAILLDTFRRYKGATPELRVPCNCRPGCTHSYRYEAVLEVSKDARNPYLRCEQPGYQPVDARSLLSGFRPTTAEGQQAVLSEMRRWFTEQLRRDRERMEKTCPSVFTLVPSKGFKVLDTWMESAQLGEELDLTLYCEHDSGWLPTEHSLYRFRPDREWFDKLKAGWNGLARVTRHVGPLAKAAGKAAQFPLAEAVGLGIEKLPEAGRTPVGDLAEALGGKSKPELIDLDTRYLLERLIDHLDSKRPATEPKNGGLHPVFVEDGRLLWLCTEHAKLYAKRA